MIGTLAGSLIIAVAVLLAMEEKWSGLEILGKMAICALVAWNVVVVVYLPVWFIARMTGGKYHDLIGLFGALTGLIAFSLFLGGAIGAFGFLFIIIGAVAGPVALYVEHKSSTLMTRAHKGADPA